MWARGRCRISPPRFLAECCKRQLNQVSYVLLYSRLSTFSDLYWVSLSVFSCTILFVSINQVIGCEDRLRNDLYGVEWGVKLYSNQPFNVHCIFFISQLFFCIDSLSPIILLLLYFSHASDFISTSIWSIAFSPCLRLGSFTNCFCRLKVVSVRISFNHWLHVQSFLVIFLLWFHTWCCVRYHTMLMDSVRGIATFCSPISFSWCSPVLSEFLAAVLTNLT